MISFFTRSACAYCNLVKRSFASGKYFERSKYLPHTCLVYQHNIITRRNLLITHDKEASNTPKMATKLSFMDVVKMRRSCYQLTDKMPISDDRVEEIVHSALTYCPSSFNSQSSRLVLLLNDEHRTFWDFVKEVLKPMVPDQKAWETTEKKLNGFRAAHGSVCVCVEV